MIKTIDELCLSVSNHLLFNMNIIKVLNPQPLSKEELFLVMLVQDFHLTVLGNAS